MNHHFLCLSPGSNFRIVNTDLLDHPQASDCRQSLHRAKFQSDSYLIQRCSELLNDPREIHNCSEFQNPLHELQHYAGILNNPRKIRFGGDFPRDSHQIQHYAGFLNDLRHQSCFLVVELQMA